MSILANIWDNENLIKILRKDGVAVMPTDTIYGIVGRAENPDTVERIYKARKRNPDRPCIILIGTEAELPKFSVSLSESQKNKLEEYWPGPVSIILDCPEDKFMYLHRGTKTLAFRLPSEKGLRELLLKTGPLVAPSANPEGLPSAENTDQAKKYFGSEVDLYIQGEIKGGKASKIIKLHNDGSETIIRI